MNEPRPFVTAVVLVAERVPSFGQYPYSIPAIRHLERLELHPQVTFFAGENGTGKSTLLEAIAGVEGLNAEGGSRNFAFSTHDNTSDLKRCLRLERPPRLLRKTDAYFFRAESFYNVATEMERLGVAYGDVPLHGQSHGEAFLTLVQQRFAGNGLYLLDEPEAALSPIRQLAFVRAVHDLVQAGSQLLIATHSPIILAYPHARIYWFSDQAIVPIEYTDTQHYRTTKAFMDCPVRMLNELMKE